MPIYDYNPADQTTDEIIYQTADRSHAFDSRVVHFGFGDVLMSCARSRHDYEDELCFQHTEPHEIGAYHEAEEPKRAVDPPVRFIFNRHESIDVLIDMLQRLKAKMIEGATNEEKAGEKSE